MALMMTTKEVAAYLKLHEITVCKYAAKGRDSCYSYWEGLEI